MNEIMLVFGFILMTCPSHGDKERPSQQSRERDQSSQYVHLSGGMFLKYDYTQNVFTWAWNHMLSARYRTSYVTEAADIQPLISLN